MSLQNRFEQVLELQKAFWGHGDDAMSDLHSARVEAKTQLERELATLLGPDVTVVVRSEDNRITFVAYKKT